MITQPPRCADVLHELAAANKPAGPRRGIASAMARLIAKRSEGRISSKTVSRYLNDGKARGFTVADEEWRDSDEPAP